VSLPYHSNDGVAYAFLGKVLSRFKAPINVFTNQGMNCFWGIPKFDKSFHYFTRLYWGRQVSWTNGKDAISWACKHECEQMSMSKGARLNFLEYSSHVNEIFEK
jgi:hypothetical protein